jgi:hypothetical protein
MKEDWKGARRIPHQVGPTLYDGLWTHSTFTEPAFILYTSPEHAHSHLTQVVQHHARGGSGLASSMRAASCALLLALLLAGTAAAAAAQAEHMEAEHTESLFEQETELIETQDPEQETDAAESGADDPLADLTVCFVKLTPNAKRTKASITPRSRGGLPGGALMQAHAHYISSRSALNIQCVLLEHPPLQDEVLTLASAWSISLSERFPEDGFELFTVDRELVAVKTTRAVDEASGVRPCQVTCVPDHLMGGSHALCGLGS